MKLVSSILGLTLASAVAIASANAADMYVPGPAPVGSYKDEPVASPLWNGLYVGINGGYGWGGDVDVTGSHTTADPITTTESAGFNPEGWFGGGQIGYNWQGVVFSPRVVFGIEADIEGADINGSATATGRHGSATAQTNLDWFGTVRGRLGYTFGSALLYATGGFAYGGVQDKLTGTSSGSMTAENDTTAAGYAVGGGLEYAFNPAWSAKVEYQYINLGTDNLAVSHIKDCVIDSASARFDLEYNTVRVGLNYHILPSYEPLK